MMKAGTIVAQLELNSRNFKQGIRDAKTSVKELGAEGETAGGKMEKLSTGMSKAGGKLTKGVTLPLAAVGGAAVKVTADFESAMSKVQATAGISDKSSTEFKKLEQAAKDMGSTTAFSANEAAEGMNYLAMAGMDSNEIVEAMPGLLDLAAASGTDLGVTADIVSDSLSAFGMEASESGKLADIMAEASASANTNVEMLGESFKYAAPVASSFGMSAEETTTALAKMADSGIKGSQAGTTLRSALTNLAKPTEEAAGWLEKLNVNTTDAEGNMRPFNDVMGDMREGMSGLTEEQKLQATSAVFGKQAMSGMLAVINTGTDDFDSFTKSLEGSDGAAKEMADKRLDNLSGQLTLLKSALEGAAITIGTALIPFIKKLVTWIQAIVDKFNNLSPQMQKIVIIFGVVAAAIGPVLLVMAKVVMVIKTLLPVFKVLKIAFLAMTGPIGLVVAAVAAAVAIGILLYKNWDKIKEVAGQLWEKIKEVFGNIGEWIVEKWTAIKESTAETWNSVKEKTSEIWNSIKEFFVGIWEGIKETVTNAINTVKDTINTIWETIKTITETVWNGIKGFFVGIFEFLKEKVITSFNFYKDLIVGVWNTISEITSTVWNTLKDVVFGIFNWIKERVIRSFNFYKEHITTIWNKVFTVTKEILGKVKKWIGEIVEKIRLVFSNSISKFKTVGKDMFSSIWDGMKNIWTGLKTWVSGKVGWLKDKLLFWRKSEDEVDSGQDRIDQKTGGGGGSSQYGRNFTGTNRWRGGLSWVGEHGPELVRVPKGAAIYPHMESMKMAAKAEGQQQAGGAGGGAPIHLHIGTLIGDRAGLRNLERKLQSVRIGENVRTGGAQHV